LEESDQVHKHTDNINTVLMFCQQLMSPLFVVGGVAVPIMQCQLGHSSLATTNTYLARIARIAPKEIIETDGCRARNH
ncbi:MAG: hypothetical protein U9N56_06085, partial [Actinomycetota bacterium]|nr:hypothetical protein [Actinomycetota bacterium]